MERERGIGSEKERGNNDMGRNERGGGRKSYRISVLFALMIICAHLLCRGVLVLVILVASLPVRGGVHGLYIPGGGKHVRTGVRGLHIPGEKTRFKKSSAIYRGKL
jgi:hypothetical protein